MREYISFTDEQKHRANAVDLEDFLLRRGERLISSGHDKRLASDHSVTICGSEWYDHEVKKEATPSTSCGCMTDAPSRRRSRNC